MEIAYLIILVRGVPNIQRAYKTVERGEERAAFSGPTDAVKLVSWWARRAFASRLSGAWFRFHARRERGTRTARATQHPRRRTARPLPPYPHPRRQAARKIRSWANGSERPSHTRACAS